MQIELPTDLVSRVQTKAALLGASEAEVIQRALDSLEKVERERLEVEAVLDGVAAYERGDHEPWEDFSKRFRQENGIAGAGELHSRFREP
jgi:predicted transcriptional regulator